MTEKRQVAATSQDLMSEATYSGRGRILRSFRPTIVRTNREAFELSEHLFAKLGGFAFASSDNNHLMSSGPQAHGFAVRLVSSTGHRISIDDDDKVSVLFPFSGTIRIARRQQTETAGPFEMLLVQPGRRETLLSRNYLGILVQVPLEDAEQLEHAWRELSGHRRRHARGVTWINRPSAVAEAHALVARVERDLLQQDSREQWRTFLARLWDCLSQDEDHRTTASVPPASLDQVRRAEAFIAANCCEALSLRAIASAIEVGPRSLQVAFYRHRRQSPLNFLHECRLQSARDRLLHSPPVTSVTAIALECGFAHLGRFSEAYRMAFGELPSQSLRGNRKAELT